MWTRQKEFRLPAGKPPAQTHSSLRLGTLHYSGRSGALAGRGLSPRMKESMLSVELGFPSLRQTSTVFLTMLTSCQHSQYTFPTYRDGNLLYQCNFVWKFLDRHVLGWNIKKIEKTEQTLSPSKVVMAPPLSSVCPRLLCNP